METILITKLTTMKKTISKLIIMGLFFTLFTIFVSAQTNSSTGGYLHFKYSNRPTSSITIKVYEGQMSVATVYYGYQGVVRVNSNACFVEIIDVNGKQSRKYPVYFDLDGTNVGSNVPEVTLQVSFYTTINVNKVSTGEGSNGSGPGGGGNEGVEP